jgi:hypothetical protein
MTGTSSMATAAVTGGAGFLGQMTSNDKELRQRPKETVAQTFEARGDAHEGVECDGVSG